MSSMRSGGSRKLEKGFQKEVGRNSARKIFRPHPFLVRNIVHKILANQPLESLKRALNNSKSYSIVRKQYFASITESVALKRVPWNPWNPPWIRH